MALHRGFYGNLDRDEPETLILRCTRSKQRLVYFPDDGFLFCPASRLRYPITEEGIPVMLLDEAEQVDEAEAERLLARARDLGLYVPD